MLHSSLAAARGGSGPRPVLVVFAAETGDAVAKARAKRARKNVDLIVANDVSQPDQGFDAETNAVTLVSENGEVRRSSKAPSASYVSSVTVPRVLA